MSLVSRMSGCTTWGLAWLESHGLFGVVFGVVFGDDLGKRSRLIDCGKTLASA